MDDVQRAIAAAWERVGPRLGREPGELLRRLGRRRSALLMHPPRAWCLAVRASDTRIRASGRRSASGDRPDAGEVVLTSHALRALCEPVYLCAPGEPLAEVARKLGTTPHGLLNARVAGRFVVFHKPALDGRWGKPHPFLYFDGPLDPAARGFVSPDPLWSHTARHVGSRIPDGIRQTLTRVAVFHEATRAYRDKSNLHPEHPDVDRSFDTRGRKRKLTLPPPEPDAAPYKWKGDVFVGYDWRAAETNPLIKKNYDRHQRELARYREANKRRRRASSASGSLLFRGWAWLCPCCGRAVRTLFYPLPRLHLLPGKLPAAAKRLLKPTPGWEDARRSFACKQCHRVRYFSHTKRSAWGEIVCYLSAGLLYGHEVERPAWLTPRRKYKYAPKLNRAPSKRRPQIERLLLAGRTINETAAELGLSKGTVLFYTTQIYQRHGVRCLKELLLKHGLPTRPGMRGPATGRRGKGRAARRARRAGVAAE